MSLRTSANSAGGGRGGYTFSGNNGNATFQGPNNLAVWAGDARRTYCGLGGRPLDYTAASGSRLFLGGGGGAGDQNNSGGGNGGDGGGLIYIMCYGAISGSGTVSSNGLNGGNGQGGTGVITGIDAAGGGGAGGTVIMNAVGGVANTLTLNTNGANGGNQVINLPASTNEAEGPGGGGGGGYIAVSSGTPTRNSNGGNNGTTNSASLTEFTPNGATKGCPGTNNAAITNFNITAAPVTVCTGNSASLTASLTGTGPAGYVFEWYSNSTGGPILFTGATYTTPVLVTGTYTYWVGTCPGWFRVPVVVTVVGTPTVTASASTNPICSGNSTTLTAGGASTYTWNPGALSGTSVVVSPVTTTTYTVTGTAVGGCFSTAQITVTVNPTPTVTASASSTLICSGNSTTLTGGGATSYVWNPGAIAGNPVVVSPATTTNYTVTGTSAGCSSTAQINITVNPTPTVTASASSTTICSGNSTTLTGGGAASYVWNPGAIPGSPISVSPATSTTYTVTGTTGGCSSTAQVAITVNPTPTVTASASSTTICSGNSTTLTGGGAASYVWNPGAIPGSPISVSPASSTTYTVTGTTSGCSSTAQVAITVNPSPTVTASASSTTICSGNSTTLTGGGATSYVWNPGALPGSPISVTPASTTTYTVTGTAANGCTGTAQVAITVNPSPTVTATAASPTICIGSSTNLTGTGAASYTWNPGALSGTTVSVTPAATTTYTMTGTAANGCTSTAQVTVTVLPNPTVTVVPTSVTICSGTSTTLTASGATTYTWNPGALSGSSVSVSPAATTTYTVTGNNGTCSSTAQATVTVIPSPTVTATSSAPTICDGASATLTGSGASSYTWMPGSLSGTSVSVTPTVTTTYTMTGTAANGCTSTANVTVTVNPNPTVTITASTNPICAGSSTTLTGSGATTYSWNPGALSGTSVSVTPASTTTYTVVGTDGNGCTNSTQLVVTVNALPTVTASSSSAAICIGGSATLTGGGASTYVWNPGAVAGSPISVSPVATTTYTVTGTDVNGCTNTAQVAVTVNPLPTPTSAAAPSTICVGATTSLSATGGTTYNWNGGSLSNAPGSSQSDAPAATTTYTVDVTDANGCTASSQVTVTVNALPVADAGIDQTVCAGTTISLNGSGGTTYTWNGGSLVSANGASQSDTPPVTTDYTLTVTDANSCVNTDTVSVNVNALPLVNAGPDVSKCTNSTIQLNASGASSYSWSPATGLDFTNIPNPNASDTIPETYVVTGTDANGCVNTDTITVNIGNNLSVNAGVDVTICSGDTAHLSTGGGVVYAWSPAGTLSSPSTANTDAWPSSTTAYIVNVTDANACSGSDTIIVNVNGPVTLSTTGTATICIGQSTTITATGSNGTSPYTYTWSNGFPGGGSQSVSPNTTTTYSVDVVDAFGCAGPQQTITVTVNPPLSIANIPATSVCAGNSVLLSASATGGDGNLTYTWNPGALTGSSVSVSPGGTTTYTCVVTDGCGTPGDTTTVTVTVNSSPTIVLGSTPENCGNSDGTANVLAGGGTPGYTYLWSNTGTTDTITGIPAGTYTVTVTDAAGCITSTSVVVGSAGSATANAGTTVTIMAGDSTQLNGTGSGTTYSWSPGTDLSCSNCQNPIASPTVTTTYTLTVTDLATGCSATDTVTVFVDENCGTIYLPNAFSPNGDGNNDFFYVRGGCIKFMQFDVYNRWGEKVFSATDPNEKWDGTWRGQECEAAVFSYYLTVTYNNGDTETFKGNVSLVK